METTSARNHLELYEALWDRYRATPRGVGWKDHREQDRRFQVMMEGSQFGVTSILDVGCGYGALVTYLKHMRPNWFPHVRYWGIDTSLDYINQAREQHEKLAKPGIKGGNVLAQGERRFLVGDIIDLAKHSTASFDLVLGSGVLAYHEMPEKLEILDAMWAMCKKALVFNMRQNHHYLGDLGFILPRFMSSNWAVRHDYGLNELTVTVRR